MAGNRLTLKDVLLQLDVQQDTQEKLRREFTEQAKRQQEQTDHIQEIDKTLTQHQQEIKELLLAKIEAPAQQQSSKTFYIFTVSIIGLLLILDVILWWVSQLYAIGLLGLGGLLLGLTILGYVCPRKFAWVGVREFKKQSTTPDSEKRQSTKTLFDWLGLLIIPFILAGGGFLITIQLHDTDMQIADMQNREAVLAAYQSSITDLLLSHKLGSVNLDDQEASRISAISAQSLTLVTVPRLDAHQKVILIEFLHNVHLINHGRPIISLNGVDLSGINLSGKNVYLGGINLSGAIMRGANLNGANLTQAYLWGTDLTGAMLKNIHLNGAYLWNAKLGEANLGGTIQKTDLSGADLSGADLSGAILRGAKHDGANFCFATLKGNDPPIAFVCPTTASSKESGLGDDLTKWSTSILSPSMAQHGKPPILVNNVANITAPTYDKDGHALQIFLLGGDPYMTLQAYRSVSFASTTTKFDFFLSFYITEFAISEVPPIQALEFTLSWGKGPIYTKEILQWQQIGDGTPQQGSPPNWRVGNGTDWQYLKQGKEQVKQELMVGKWYTFDLKGEIMGNMMRFLSFSCVNDFGVANDNASTPLDQIQPFAFSPLQDPMSLNNQLINVGIQMDGNAHEDPYDVYLDEANFQPM
jgi:uncharacterized protein YjbI with pentapeptide repeats